MFEGIVATVLNRFLGNYVTNLQTNQLKLGIWQGDMKLEKLQLKTDALDKLHLPIDVKEGWLGTLTITIPWSNLKNEPVRITINDVFVLATPRFQENFDPEEEEEREFAHKMHKLENDELLRQQPKGDLQTDDKKQASFTDQLITKIVDNLQIVIKNIHIRYEDRMSNPDHCFAIGATLGEISAISTDAEWRETFLHDSSSIIHKMLKLAEFSMYWDIACESFQNLSHNEISNRLKTLESCPVSLHESILQPVTGIGKVTMNKRPRPEDTRNIAKFEFDQLAFELDDKQYADALLLTNQFDYAMRQRRYRKHHPPPGVRPKDNPRAWLLFAILSVYDEVHDHNRRKTWEFQKERRDDRLLYLRIYTALKVNGTIPEVDRAALDQLHRKLSYQDIRFYRALAEPKIRKQLGIIRRAQERANGQAGSQNTGGNGGGVTGGGVAGWVGGWLGGWVSGGNADNSLQANDTGTSGGGVEDKDDTQLTEEQVQELYDTIEFNEDEAIEADYDLPTETIKLSASILLRSGSLKLKIDRKTRDHTLMGFFYDALKVDLIQRPKNLSADVSVHRFEVLDGTLLGTQYPRMIYLQHDSDLANNDSKDKESSGIEMLTAVPDAPGGLAAENNFDPYTAKDPFLKIHFEKDPLDGHADSVLNMKVRSLNVIYHPKAAKAIMNFFEPPSSASAESMHALIAAASKSVAGFREQTRAGLEYALAKHKTVDVKIDFDAPVFVIPQDVTDPNSEVVVLDTGYLTVESQLVDNITTERIRQRENHVLSEDEMKDLESLMYDHFDMKLHRTQLLIGNDLDTCIKALSEGQADTKLHVVDRIELNFDLGLCILSEPPTHMPKVTVDGSLPSLQVFFSDRKYKAIMGSIDLIMEAISDDEVDLSTQYEVDQPTTAFGAGGIFQNHNPDYGTSSADPALVLTGASSSESDDNWFAQAQTRSTTSTTDGKDKKDADDDESSEVFFETTDQIDDNDNVSQLKRKQSGENTMARASTGKDPEQILVKVNFAVDNLIGFVWRTHMDGRDDLHIADIAVTGFAVECINRPFDLFANVTIHQITIEDHLMGGDAGPSPNSPAQHVYALTSDIAQADANGEIGKNLVAVKYHRCQADHPEFTTTYESIGQTVDVDISYLDLMVVRKTILTSYDFILKTFTDEGSNRTSPINGTPGDTNNNSIDHLPSDHELSGSDNNISDGSSNTPVSSSVADLDSLIKQALDTIRVDVRFKGTDFSLCHDDGTPIALLSVTEAMARVTVTQQTLLEAKVGSITLADQLDLVPSESDPLYGSHRKIDRNRLLLYVKGDELADFRYQSFDPKSPSYPGHNAAINLRVGAAHMAFVERPMCELMLFGSRFSAMHGLFEAARQAAANGTTQLTEEMMNGNQKFHFDIVMSAPVILFPRDGFIPYSQAPANTTETPSKTEEINHDMDFDVLIVQPGELSISNEFTTVRECGKDWDINHISLGLRRIGIKSSFVIENDETEHGSFGQSRLQVLQILEDVDYRMDMHLLMKGHIPDSPRPVTELIGALSPIKMKLTEYQYKMVYDLLGVIGRVFGTNPNAPVIPDPLINDRQLDLSILRENPAISSAQTNRQALENLGQNISASEPNSDDSDAYATLDLYVTLSTIQIELFEGSGFHLEHIQQASFTRADINELATKYRSKSNGDSKAELSIKAVRAYDTRPTTSNQFTQLISPMITSHTAKDKRGATDEARSSNTGGTSDSWQHHSMHAVAQDTPIEEDATNPQLVCHIDMRPNQDMVVLLTLDSPRIICVLDHISILTRFATSVLPPQSDTPEPSQAMNSDGKNDGTNTGNTTAQTPGGLIYKVDVIHPEIILLANPKIRSSEALILSVNQIIIAQEGMFCATMDEIGVSLCTIDRRRDTSRSIMDPFTIISTMDTRITPGNPSLGIASQTLTDVSVDVGSLLLRLGISDIILMLDIFNTAMGLLYKTDEATNDDDESGSKNGKTEEHDGSGDDFIKLRNAAFRTSSFVANRGESPVISPKHVSSQFLAVPGSQSSAGSTPARFSEDITIDSASESNPITNRSASPPARAAARIIKETMHATISSLRVVIIRDMFGLPAYACMAKEFHVDINDWSINRRVKTDLNLQVSYFNRRNSHWEPFIEPWSCALNMIATEVDNQITQKVDINSTDRLQINASHTFIEETLGMLYQWGDEMEKYKKRQQEGGHPVGERMPYVLINRTGIDCHVWVDLPEGATARSERIDTTPVLLRDGESLPWRFEDWRRRREQIEAKLHHLGIQFANGQWEWLRRVQVDREGTKHYTLQPAINDIQHRLAVEVKLDAVNLVKKVILRSPLVVENQTRIGIEVAMCDYRGELKTDSAVIQPGEDLPLPIMFCHQYSIRVRPEAGFGYGWSTQYIYWRDFLGQDARSELCCLPQSLKTTKNKNTNSAERSADDVYGGGRNSSSGDSDPDVMPFYIHFNALCDSRNPALYKYPFMRLVMTPPLEIENLLPYPMTFCVVDKTSNRTWVNSLQRGGISPVHAVQPGHLLLLTIRISGAGFDECDGTIIESNDEDEYPVDEDIVMTDNDNIKLALKLRRMDIPNSGGQCRRVSIYAPYVMVNRTGLDLKYSSKSFFKGLTAVAGQNVNANRPIESASTNLSFNSRSRHPSSSSRATARASQIPTNEFMASNTSASSVHSGQLLSSRPLMFSFGSYDFRNRALVCVANAGWSKPLSFDTLGSSTELVIPSTDQASNTHLGIEIEPGRGRYSNTRVVTFSSRYVIKNMSGIALQYRTVYNTQSSVRLDNGERRPLHTLHRAHRRLVTVACAPIDQDGVYSMRDADWSTPFSIDEIGRVYIRLPSQKLKDSDNDDQPGERLLKVDIIMEGACLFMIVQRETRCWPYRIENRTLTDVVVWQYKETRPGVDGSDDPSFDSSYIVPIGSAKHLTDPLQTISELGGSGGSSIGIGRPRTQGPQSGVSSKNMPYDRKYTIKAGEYLDYAWDRPIAARKLLILSVQGKTHRVSLQEIGEQTPFIYGKPPVPSRRPTTAAALTAQAIAPYAMNIDVVARGPAQVLRLTRYASEPTLYVPQPGAVVSGYQGSKISKTSTAYSVLSQESASESSISGSSRKPGEGKFEVVEPDEKTNFIFRLGLEGGIGMSLINKYSSEILFATLSDVEFKFTDSTSNQTFKLIVKWIQIDNQIYGALFPIVLYPTTLGSSAMGTAPPPVLQSLMVRAKDNSHGVEYFKYASILAQELSVELDEDFLYALLDFVEFDMPGESKDEDKDTQNSMLDSDIPEVKAFDEGLQLYFEFLHIQPFKLNISFMRTQRPDSGAGNNGTARYSVLAGGSAVQSGQKNIGSITMYNPRLATSGSSGITDEQDTGNTGIVAYATNVLTMAIGNINEAPVYLNALIMQNVRVSLPILMDRMHKHYSQEVFAQVYKVVGSANFLGNPVGLFNNISSGVSDFFYEPYQGFVMSDRPQDFGYGLARGTASLFKKTVFGMTDSFSKFTDSVSKGLSAATLDPQYQTERRMSRARNKPKHAIYGVARGAESFAKSVTSGIAGVVMRPIEGAEQEGVGGFIKGMGKGLVGVVTKPMIGMFDLASNVTEGIRNTTTVFERDLDRQRLPRYINRDGILTIYSGRESLGQAWMRELNKGAYAYDDYLAHLELPGSDMVVLLTYQRLIMFRRAKPDDAGMAVGSSNVSTETGSATGSIGVSASNAARAQVEWEQEIKSLHSIQLETTGISLKLPATPEGYVPPGPFIPVSDPQSRRWFYNQIKIAVKALVDDRKELG